MKFRLSILCLLIGATLTARAQEHYYLRDGDTVRYNYTPLTEESATPAVEEPATEVKRNGFLHRLINYFNEAAVDHSFDRKIDVTFAGGPSYSKTDGLGIGVLASGIYRLDRTDSITPPSTISLSGSISIKGVYSISITGNTIFKHQARRLNYTLMFSSTPREIWGFGYEAARWNESFGYTEKDYRIQGDFQQRIARNTYLGALIDFQYTKGKKFEDTRYLAGQKTAYTACGFGVLAEYDSRDFIPNPYRGLYLSVRQFFYPKGLGNCNHTLWRTRIILDGYQPLWKGGILAADLFAEFNSEHTPWPMLARLGDNYRMRGYYTGRYADHHKITLQVELRQHLWRRFGCTVWGGAGNVFPTLDQFKWKHTLPNYGLGVRWEFKKRVNVRMDYGFGKRCSGFVLSVNEAF